MNSTPKKPPFSKVAAKLRWLGFLLPPIGELKQQGSSFLLAGVSVLLLRLCYPTFNLWPLAFVALLPWLWGLRRTTPRVAFWISWAFGTLFFLTMFWWLMPLDRFNKAIYLGIPLLSAYVGFYTAIQGAGMIYAARRLPPWLAFVFAAVWWMGWEWVRSVGQLAAPLTLLGHSVVNSNALLQVSSFGGVHLLSGLVLLVNLALMETLAAAQKKAFSSGTVSRLATSLGLLVLCFVVGAGIKSRIRADIEDYDAINVALIQPNVDQEKKFASYSDPSQEVRDQLQAEMTSELFDLIDSIEPGTVDLVVTPESAITEYFFNIASDLQSEIRMRANEIGAPIIVGATDNVYRTIDRSYSEDIREAHFPSGYLDFESYVALYVFRPGETDDKLIADFRKVHLAPFGEAVPFFDLIPGLQDRIVQVGTFLRGRYDQPPVFINVEGHEPDTVPSIQLGPTICFESMISRLHRMWAGRGAQLFVNITNNAWFDPSKLPEYHLQYARVRCAETRLPMIHSCNTGITAVIDAGGVVADRFPRLEKGVMYSEIRFPTEPRPTIYTRLGDWPLVLSFLSSLLLFVGLVFRDRKESKSNNN